MKTFKQYLKEDAVANTTTANVATYPTLLLNLKKSIKRVKKDATS